MAKSKSTGKRGATKASASVKKDLALVSKIGRWLIVIALSGIALSLLLTVAAAVIFATVVAPRISLMADRLRASPAMSGTPKEKCVAFFTEAGRVLMPDDTDEQVTGAAEHACSTKFQAKAGSHMFDAAVSGPAHAAHAASVSAAVKSNAKAKAMPFQKLADGEPDPHTTADNLGGDAATHAAPAGGLGTHA